MMEVKQNTAVDLNDLLAGSNNNSNDEVDDAVMTDLTNRAHDLVNCGLIKTNDKSANVAEIENGDMTMASLLNDVDETDLNVTVSSELEDALLAEDDVLLKTTNSKVVEQTSVVASIDDDILADKVETSNSTTSSSNARDPGDDLDTLLSKINDIVEDCIDNESENTVLNTLNAEQVISEITETPETQESNLTKNEIFVEEKLNENNSIEKDKVVVTPKTIVNNADVNALEPTESSESLKKRENSKIPDIFTDMQVLLSNVEEEKDKNNDKLEDEYVDLPANIESDVDEVSIKENGADNTLTNNNNQHQEKTEESKPAVVQDNEITSNCEDISEIVKTLPSPSLTINDANEVKETTSTLLAKTNDAEIKSEEDIAVSEEKAAKQTDDSTSTEEAKSFENIENDDSDDEIVFYVDKLPEKSKESETKTETMKIEAESVTTLNEKSILQKDISSPPGKTVEDDDDVVLLLDDDDDEVAQAKKEQTEISPKKKEVKEASDDINTLKELKEATKEAIVKDVVIDNSDNACDDFVVAENINENDKSSDKLEVAETPDETNSNCSSSSNLLQEAQIVKTTADEIATEEADIENEEEEDDNEVELIESELKESETSEKVEDSQIAPPAKRIRLSEDAEHLSKAEESGNESKEDVDTLKKQEAEQIPTEETTNALKRSHDEIEEGSEEKLNESKIFDEGAKKKIRTETESTKTLVEIEDDKTSENIKSVPEDKMNIKVGSSQLPILLYPPPKFELLKSEPSISLEFLKKFRKSFDHMTKQDLEELVLQKVVEAIIHRSEFSEMRELIEKQEKLITAHRTKISELSKQFRDLEMVHNRVVKDIEQRNSQFIMPVKITRAVGLQVYIPNKKSLTETAVTGTGSSVPSSPQRPASSQTSTSSSSTLTPSQRQFITSQTETQRSTTTASTGSGGSTTNVRRGCVQKITPIRPVPGANSTSSAGPSSAAAVYRNTPNHSVTAPPRILNKNAVTTAPNPTAIQRSRYLGSNQDGQRISTQQQISRTPNMPASGQRVAGNAAATQSKPSSNIGTTVQRRSEPQTPGAANNSSSIVDNYINTLTHLTGGNTAVSITPAKPKEKAVIDLTDEDETPGQTPSAQPATQLPVTQVPRRSLPVQNSANSQQQYGRTAPPLARIPSSNQMANNKNRQMSSLQGQKNNSFTSINTPPGTSITRINVSSNVSNVQRVKYSHPAPLPATPPQAFNPAWKLPPPRPTIRISNLDNGIVISWTMEESMDRHAECVSYQIYAYQETSGPPMVDSWRHVGDVKAMLLPMAVTLTQFQEGQRYYFAVRAVDCHQRFGPFSLPKTWS